MNELVELLKRFEWKMYKICKRARVKCKNLTILSSNCNGTYIYHDLGLEFQSPTINLYFEMEDFLKFLSNLDHYLASELHEIKTSEFDYPVGILDDIKIYFMHYSNFEEAKNKWIERCHRINPNNIVVIATNRNGCTENHIKEFDNLPYKKKVLFTHKEYKQYPSTFYIRGFESSDCVGILSNFMPTIRRRRYLDQFDYVNFINNK